MSSEIIKGLMTSGRTIGRHMNGLQADRLFDLAFAAANRGRHCDQTDAVFTAASVAGTILDELQAAGMSLDDIETVASGFGSAVVPGPMDHLQRDQARHAFRAGLWQSRRGLDLDQPTK